MSVWCWEDQVNFILSFILFLLKYFLICLRAASCSFMLSSLTTIPKLCFSTIFFIFASDDDIIGRPAIVYSNNLFGKASWLLIPWPLITSHPISQAKVY